jgi:hypothetical protein
MVQIVKKCPNATAQIHFHLTTRAIAIVREIGMVNFVIVQRHKTMHVSSKKRSAKEVHVPVRMDIPGLERAVEVCCVV